MKKLNRILTHPGDVLKEELESRDIKQKEFAALIGISYTMLNEILNAKRPMTTDFALLVEAALGINAELWVKMQMNYNLSFARSEKKMEKRIKEIKRVLNISPTNKDYD